MKFQDVVIFTWFIGLYDLLEIIVMNVVLDMVQPFVLGRPIFGTRDVSGVAFMW
jgi:hypothetical protein